MMPFSKRLTASWCLEVIWEWKLSFWHRKWRSVRPSNIASKPVIITYT
jgi:hypothetical protein